MSTLVTIYSVSFPDSPAIIKARLDSEGIECFTQNETTIQVDPLISNAVGGIKIQVKEQDAQQALEILYSEGYLRREDMEKPETYSGLQRFADKLPFLRQQPYELRLGVFMVVLIVVFSSLLYFLLSPTK
jgi:cytochrome bd-type quinol oxidase subunit 1